MLISYFCNESKIPDLEIYFRFVAIFASQEDVRGFDVTMEETFLPDFLKTRANLRMRKNGSLKGINKYYVQLALKI